MKDGGPAFPNDCHPSNNPDGKLGYRGMTLRDYFAAKAMQGILTSTKDPRNNDKVIVGMAYHIADAMLKERESHA